MNKVFESISKLWWDKNGPCKPLHIFNAIRLDYIKKKITINGKRILDIGCGAGILSEKLAMHGGFVTGVDISKNLINIAKSRSKKMQTKIIYINSDIKNFILSNKEKFNIIISMEVLEHLESKNDLINAYKNASSKNCDIFISSLNKSIKAYFKMILLAEFFTNNIKKNTHNYDNFLSIDKLEETLVKENFYIKDVKGLNYNPISCHSKLSTNDTLNYLIHAKINDL